MRLLSIAANTTVVVVGRLVVWSSGRHHQRYLMAWARFPDAGRIHVTNAADFRAQGPRDER